MNLGEMKTALKRHGFTDDDPLEEWINAGMHMLEDEFNWNFLEDVVNTITPVGVDTVNLGGYVKHVNVVRIESDPNSLPYVPVHQFMEEIEDFTTTGRPNRYTVYAQNRLSLYPISDVNYDLRVLVTWAEPPIGVGSDLETPTYIPVPMHYTIVEAAVVKALQAENEEDRASAAERIYDSSVLKHVSAWGGGRKGGSFQSTRDVMGYGS